MVTTALYRVLRKINQALHGLSLPQYVILTEVASEVDPVTTSVLLPRLGMTSAMLSMVTKELVAKGLLQVERRKEDERTVGISITESGSQLLTKVPELPLKPEKLRRLESLLEELDEELATKPSEV